MIDIERDVLELVIQLEALKQYIYWKKVTGQVIEKDQFQVLFGSLDTCFCNLTESMMEYLDA